MPSNLSRLALCATLCAPAFAQTASFTYTSLAQNVIQFTDTSTGGTPTTWAWDFDADGVIDDTTSSPVWVYPGPGIYPCTLTVGFGAVTDTVTQNVFNDVLPIPEYGSTFSSGSLTRGFWLQAPTRFSIVGLRVPDESGHGLQNVAVYRLAGQPPTYSASATGGLEFVSIGQPSSAVLPCAVSFDAGEYVGVLGACGDATTMRNSYANVTGPQPSEIFGQPTTLTRFLTQTNIASNNGVGAYSEEPNGALSRVEVTLSQCVGLPYGDGSPSSLAPAPVLRTTQLPFLGATAELTVDNSDTGAIGVLAVGIGRLNVPSPLGTVLINGLVTSVALNGGALMNPGQYTYQFAVPANGALQGYGPVNWQAASLIVSNGEFALSNANEWWLATH